MVACHHADAHMTQRMLHMRTDLFGAKDCIEVDKQAEGVDSVMILSI